MPKRILIADDHGLLRQALRQLLSDEFPDFAVAEAEDLDSVMVQLAVAPADLVLMDLGMPGMAGAESLLALRAAHPNSRILVVTGTEERCVILECLAAGVHGYVLKSSPAEDIVRAVRQTLAGDIYVAPVLAAVGNERAFAQRRAGAPALAPAMRPGTARFTGRQMHVLKLLSEGRSTKEIARVLELSPGTVKIHLAAIYRRLNAHNRTEAAMLASKLNL
ncbi:MAG TPA: response regulator transcription factor [Acetobacteraceae bacterium]|jgi:DNA-binding NarL/FixJ family response regulator